MTDQSASSCVFVTDAQSDRTCGQLAQYTIRVRDHRGLYQVHVCASHKSAQARRNAQYRVGAK